MQKERKLTSSLEEYLKVIYEITQTEPVARVKTIAKHMGVSLPSVTNALKRLDVLGYVRYEKYGLIMLSEKGIERAQKLEKTCCILRTLLVDFIGVPESDLSKITCRIDHYSMKRPNIGCKSCSVSLEKRKTAERNTVTSWSSFSKRGRAKFPRQRSDPFRSKIR